MSSADAIEALGLRDYAGLLVALGDRDLVPPRPPADEIERQAALFERIWVDAEAGAQPGDDDLAAPTQ